MNRYARVLTGLLCSIMLTGCITVSKPDDADKSSSQAKTEEKAEAKSNENSENQKQELAAPAETSSTVGGKWVDLDKRQFAVNGKTYTLGKTTLQEMIDDGVPFTEDSLSNAGNNVNVNYESSNFKIKLGNFWDAYVCVANYGTSNAPAKSLPVTYVSFTSRDDKTQNVISFTFPFTMTEAQLRENAGEPTESDKYESEGYVSNTYEYKVESSRYYGDSGYEFDFVNGELDSVTIDYMP